MKKPCNNQLPNLQTAASLPGVEIFLPIRRPNALASADTRWCRIALLLTGDATAAGAILRGVFADAPEELAQLRGKTHRKHWMASHIRSRSLKWRHENAAPLATADSAPLASRIAALPEPTRSAFVFFHTLEGDMEETTHLLGMDTTAFAHALQRARKALAPESAFPENALLVLHRPWGKDEPKVAKAAQAAQGDPAFAAQIAADSRWHEEIEQIAIPETVLQCAKMPTPKKRFFHPALLAISLAATVIVGVLVYFAKTHMENFPGKDLVIDLVLDVDSLKESAFEPLPATDAGKLDDWFVMKGFEGFAVPPELQKAKAVGCRVTRHDGMPVAQILLSKQKAILVVIHGADAKLEPNKTGWQPAFQQDEWAVQTWLDKSNACTVMFKGDSEDMPGFLETVGK